MDEFYGKGPVQIFMDDLKEKGITLAEVFEEDRRMMREWVAAGCPEPAEIEVDSTEDAL